MMKKQSAWLFAVMALFCLTLLRALTIDWQPQTLSDKQFNQHYALNITENGKLKASGVNQIKAFTTDNTIYQISIDKKLNPQNVPDISIDIRSKKAGDKNAEFSSPENCNNHCSFHNNKYQVSYQSLDFAQLNAKWILSVACILSAYLFVLLMRKLPNFNRLMYVGISIILFYRLMVSLGLVAQKVTGIHYIINNLIVFLVVPVLLTLWTTPFKQIQPLKKQLFMYFCFVFGYLLVDLFYLNWLFGSGFYDYLLPMTANYNTAGFEFAVTIGLVVVLFARFLPITDKLLNFMQTHQSAKWFFLGIVLLLMVITTVPYLLGQAKHLPFEIWVAFSLAGVLPVLLQFAVTKKQPLFAKKLFFTNQFGGYFLLGIAMIVLAVGVFAVWKDGGSLIYGISSVIAFTVSLIWLFNQQNKLAIHQFVNAMYVVIIVATVGFMVLVGIKAHHNHQLTTAWQPSENTFSDNIQTSWLTSLAKPDCQIASHNPNFLTADEIQKIDSCFQDWSKENKNSQMRIYGWLFGHPFNHVLSNNDMGRLQNIEQLKAYHFPKSLHIGDGYMISSSHIQTIKGYEYEHILGAVIIKPMGLFVACILIVAWFCLYYSVPKNQISTRTFIGSLGFVTMYIILQSLFVVPFFGNNSPFMSVSSFVKDTLPMISGLIVFVIFGRAISIEKLDMNTNSGS